MAEKAVKITRDNIEYLTKRFAAEEDATPSLTVGLILVAPFRSEDDIYELITLDELFANFAIGGKLKNDFFEVRRLSNG